MVKSDINDARKIDYLRTSSGPVIAIPVEVWTICLNATPTQVTVPVRQMSSEELVIGILFKWI